ncbi:protein FAM199X [Lingula anatina]|uniref:Protein FAM199X n=1 Tax=Lingula anatina TaxID=7574 RepID=A0A1S3JN48_LINAN|nr:protein FAM199X [Lingula anatina]|eukprot:XP_013411787.1 protein FAM199X [Lingula anatina]
MIADTPLLTSSPWQSESPLTKDYKNVFLDIDSMIDMDFNTLEAEVKRVRNDKSQSLSTSFQTYYNITSSGTSVASSECSEETFLDLEKEVDDTNFTLFSLSDVNEDLDTSFSKVLENNSQDTLETHPWTDNELGITTDVLTDIIPTLPISPPSPRKRTHSESFTDNKPWSNMTSQEQISTIEELTRIISEEMGLREQIEVIRIISPNAQVSPTDTEFVIELDWLNDEKLQRLRKYVKQHSSNSSINGDHCSSCSSVSDHSDVESPQKKAKRGLNRERRNQLKLERQRQRKEYRQMMRERRSGLFHKEEVLALTNFEPVEEEVDILT